MANLWEKVKDTLEQGARTVKELADTIGDKAQEMMTAGQLKVKHYNLNHDVSELFNEIGGKVYEKIKNKQKDIYADPDIMKMIENVKNLESQIDEVEKKMEEAKKPKPDEGDQKAEQVEEV
jgi:seryl-tRNA synthetase